MTWMRTIQWWLQVVEVRVEGLLLRRPPRVIVHSTNSSSTRRVWEVSIRLRRLLPTIRVMWLTLPTCPHTSFRATWQWLCQSCRHRYRSQWITRRTLTPPTIRASRRVLSPIHSSGNTSRTTSCKKRKWKEKTEQTSKPTNERHNNC